MPDYRVTSGELEGFTPFIRAENEEGDKLRVMLSTMSSPQGIGLAVTRYGGDGEETLGGLCVGSVRLLFGNRRIVRAVFPRHGGLGWVGVVVDLRSKVLTLHEDLFEEDHLRAILYSVDTGPYSSPLPGAVEDGES